MTVCGPTISAMTGDRERSPSTSSAPPAACTDFPRRSALHPRDASVLGFAISNASVADLADAAVAINHMLATGDLRGRVGATFHLAEAAAAHRALEAGGVRGRILILP